MQTTRGEIIVLGGWDSSQGSGLDLDLRVAQDLNVKAHAIATCETKQTDQSFTRLGPIPAETIIDQLMGHKNRTIGAIKVGAIGFWQHWHQIIPVLKNFDAPIIVDPVLKTTSGGWLLEPKEPEGIRHFFLSLIGKDTDLLTPNTEEAQFLTAQKTLDLYNLSTELKKICHCPFLIKGPYKPDSKVLELRYTGPEAEEVFSQKRLAKTKVRGTGCALATGLACHYLQNNSWPQSIRQTLSHLHNWIKDAREVSPAFFICYKNRLG